MDGTRYTIEPPSKALVKYEIEPPRKSPIKASSAIGSPAKFLGIEKHTIKSYLDVLPYVGGAFGGVVGATAGVGTGAIPGAMLGGMAGEATRELGERVLGVSDVPGTSREAMRRMAGAEIEQGLIQAGGELLGPIARGAGRLFRPAAGKVAGETVGPEAVRQVGIRLGLTAPEIAGKTEMGGIGRGLQNLGELGIIGQTVAERSKQRVAAEAERMATEQLDLLGQTSDLRTAGKIVEHGLREGLAEFRQLSEQLFEKEIPAIAEKQQVTVETKLLVDEARRLIEVPKPLRAGFTAKSSSGRVASFDLPENVRKAYEAAGVGGSKELPPGTSVEKILGALQSLKPKLTWQEATEVRQWLNTYAPTLDQTFAKPGAQSISRHLEGILEEQMGKSAQAKGGELAATWLKARNLWRTGRDIYDSTYIQGLMNKNPEALVDAIKLGDATDIARVRKALLGHTGIGTKTPSKAGQTAWDSFRRQFLESKLLKDPEGTGFDINSLRGLKSRINAAGPDQLGMVFGTDQRGRMVLQNLRAFAEATSRIVPVRNHPLARIIEVAGMTAGTMTRHLGYVGSLEGVPYVLTKVLYNRAATRLLTRGIDISAINVAQATSLITRSLVIAGQAMSGKQATKEEAP